MPLQLRAIASLEQGKSQLAMIFRTPRADGEGTPPQGDGIIVSSRLVGKVRGVSQGGFPIRFQGQGRLECGLGLRVPADAAQRDPLALPGRHVVGPCRQGRLEQGHRRRSALGPFIRPGQSHTDLAPGRGAFSIIHQVAVENHQSTFAVARLRVASR